MWLLFTLGLAFADDQDGDGYASIESGGDDCDDVHSAVHPGANDVFYDGVDADCLGNDDFDADGDTFDSDLFGGDDCDDHEYTTHPGAPDPAYDGVDADCAGDDDYDADGDGFVTTRVGGDDCDDTDPDTHPGAPDTLGDKADQDCDGTPARGRTPPGSDTAKNGCAAESAAIWGVGALTLRWRRRSL